MVLGAARAPTGSIYRGGHSIRNWYRKTHRWDDGKASNQVVSQVGVRQPQVFTRFKKGGDDLINGILGFVYHLPMVCSLGVWQKSCVDFRAFN